MVGLQSRTCKTYLHISIRHARLRAQRGANITDLAFVARFLLELADSSFLWGLTLVDETGWKLDAIRFDWWAVLKDHHG